MLICGEQAAGLNADHKISGWTGLNVCVILRLASVDIPDKMCEDLSYDKTAKYIT